MFVTIFMLFHVSRSEAGQGLPVLCLVEKTCFTISGQPFDLLVGAWYIFGKKSWLWICKKKINWLCPKI